MNQNIQERSATPNQPNAERREVASGEARPAFLVDEPSFSLGECRQHCSLTVTLFRLNVYFVPNLEQIPALDMFWRDARKCLELWI